MKEGGTFSWKIFHFKRNMRGGEGLTKGLSSTNIALFNF